jgi:hypothetical protein
MVLISVIIITIVCAVVIDEYTKQKRVIKNKIFSNRLLMFFCLRKNITIRAYVIILFLSKYGGH